MKLTKVTWSLFLISIITFSAGTTMFWSLYGFKTAFAVSMICAGVTFRVSTIVSLAVQDISRNFVATVFAEPIEVSSHSSAVGLTLEGDNRQN